MNVIKRDGSEVKFEKSRIYIAISKANASVPEDKRIPENTLGNLVDTITSWCEGLGRAPKVEEIQDKVQTSLADAGYGRVAMSYAVYRYARAEARKKNTIDDAIMTLIDGSNEEMNQENSNKNPREISVQRDYMAGIVSKDLCRRVLYPADVMEAHDRGVIHIHDLDYVVGHLHNCELINLEDMLQNGTVIHGNMIEQPKSFLTACTVATQISASVSSNTFGGQTISLAHLSPFINVSRQKIRAQVTEELNGMLVTDSDIERIVESRVRREVKSGVQTIQYQVSTIMCSNGQSPFISIMMYLGEAKDEVGKQDLALLIEEVLKQRIEGVKNETGVCVTPAFPKLLYVLTEENCREDTPYWYLTELAAKCTAKRLVPDYISEKKMMEYKIDGKGRGNVYPCMGCRAFLTPDPTGNGFDNVANAKNYVPGESKYYGRFNLGACSLNLPYIALEAGRDVNKFWEVLDKYANLAYKAQQVRADRLKGVKSDVAPILWQYGALARLDKGETIDKLLYNGYATISLGYVGLWECVMTLIGKKLTEPEGLELGETVMKKLNEYTMKWREEQNMHYSLYGTPAETLAGRFAAACTRDFGVIKDITDHSYETNSYHVNVREKITAFDKLELESKLQKLSPGGAISYVEVPNLQNNIPAVLAIIKFIYDHIMYAELNTKSDYCQVCKYDGEIKIITDDNGKLIWECPKCGNRDQSKMNVARRTCGYIGSQFWGQGRTAEIKDRVLHVD